MFNILRQSLSVGIVTTDYPETPPEIASCARGRPEIDFAAWQDARPAAAACPTGALAVADTREHRDASLDLGKCTFCGLCAEADPSAIRMTNQTELAVRSRSELKTTARYGLNAQGAHTRLLEIVKPPAPSQSLATLAAQLRERIAGVLSRSLHIRQVDAGSCNGCEVEIHGLNSPIYDLERFGLHFVASPRHADLLMVTGPVTRNMELALKKTYDATPGPRVVMAVGACGCSGGVFGCNYATVGAVDAVIPVDIYLPGCPPNPHALLHALLMAVGRLEEKKK